MEVKMDSIWFLIGLLLFAATFSSAQRNNETRSNPRNQRSYVCPPDFIRIGQHCYFFSKDMQTWQQAFFECQDRFSDLVIIRNGKEDKSLKHFLNNQHLVPLERWIGGIYNWEQMQWKWAASGKELRYQGFSRLNPYDKESLRWHCIVMDPQMQYKWNSRSCVHHKHYICQKRIRAITNKERQKLKRKYKVNKDHRLNEVPIPMDNRREDELNLNSLQSPNNRHQNTFDNNDLNAVAFARRNNETVAVRGKGLGRKRNRNNGGRRNNRRNGEGPQTKTINEQRWNRRDFDHKRNRRFKNKDSTENLQNSLKKKKNLFNEVPNALHPQVIVEDVDIPRV